MVLTNGLFDIRIWKTTIIRASAVTTVLLRAVITRPVSREKPNLLPAPSLATGISQLGRQQRKNRPLPLAAACRTFCEVKRSDESFVAQDELSDPFGESHLVATLPPSSSALGLKGAALLIALAILLLLVRGLAG
jgi:hypothetical protein